MKKNLSLIVLLTAATALTACSGIGGSSKELTKEGIAPYELSDSEKNLFISFGMLDTSQIISFKAPKEAITLNANVYQLDKNGTWEMTGHGAMSIGKEREPVDQLSGLFTMQLRDHFAIDFNFNCAGLASYKTDEIEYDIENFASTKGFLQEFQKIELNTEMPVAIMVYDSGTSMQSYTPQDYFEPSKFKDMDLVQAVTLEFTDKEF
ncbi:hypothetical protein NXH76_00800 [Blautia schinkii]|nr:hypothetical protein [Blautia schinkii]